jgi:hypothetical protein
MNSAALLLDPEQCIRNNNMSSMTRGRLMTNSEKPCFELLIEAANHLRLAIQLLDRASAPGHIAANADLALHQVENLIPARAMSRTAPDLSLGLGSG